MAYIDNEKDIHISSNVVEKWQSLVDIVAELLSIPSALIMRLVNDDLEVFVSSKGEENPYNIGDHDHFLGSGLYCETVIKNRDKLLIPNALKSDIWNKNPDIKLGMISYLGFPLTLPNGAPFGTICVLDNKENSYSLTFEKLMNNFREIIQSELDLIFMNETLGEENKKLTDYIAEIKDLRGILPICSSCKSIRDDKGYWLQVEEYLSLHSNAQLTHGICEKCTEELYGKETWYKKLKKS